MFKVKIALSGPLCLDLERGSINLIPNKAFDLEQVCSRKWIDTNPKLRELIKKGVLIVVFDNRNPNMPKHSVGRRPIPPPPAHAPSAVKAKVAKHQPQPGKKAKPVVIDLVSGTVSEPANDWPASDPTALAPVAVPEDFDVVESRAAANVVEETKKPVEQPKPATTKQSKPNDIYEEENLRNSSLDDLRAMAVVLGIDPKSSSKTKLIRQIRRAVEHQD